MQQRTVRSTDAHSLEHVQACSVHVSANDARHKRRRNSFSKRSKSSSMTCGSGGFCKKGGGLSSDVFHRQSMAVIGIENEAVGFVGDLQGVAQEIRLLDGNQKILFTMQDQRRRMPHRNLRQDADELRILFATRIQHGMKPPRCVLIEPI